MGQNLNVRAETIKLGGKKTGVNLPDLGFGNRFSALIPKTQMTKERDKMDFIKAKTFMHQRTLSRVKRTCRVGENVCKP